MSQTKNDWPVKDFFEDSAEGFIEKHQSAKVVGQTTFNTDRYSIPFLHIGLELDNHNEGHSWGVVELDSMQLQIQITEYLNDVNSTDNFLKEDIQKILETLEIEE
ncbi:hypothetical protein [Marinoscillum sp. MHG1-6]|uniref:hypothetical protein n=1 Tax=Marinoscillum sp. MHG1-6 TaxID=2959627 RepID=UPI0021570451|nr:hypothetical protein [Marinoscillum sp. MHG1-6]